MPSLRSMDPEPTPLEVTDPEAMFPCDLDQARHIYHQLAGRWHPDHNKDARATRIFQHITDLYSEAVRRIEKGVWQGEGVLKTPDETLRYMRSFSFELGQTYLGKDHVTYLVDAKYERLYKNALRMIDRFDYANDEMRKEVVRYLPVRTQTFRTSDRLGLIVRKHADLLRLRDVVAYYEGRMSAKHAAWILSTIYNLCCYLQYAKIVHHDISMDTYFICPHEHSGALFGGWWYAAQVDREVSEVPTRTSACLPWKAKTEKLATHLSDQELVRVLGRELLEFCENAPKPMQDWVKNVAEGSSVENYSGWKQVAKDSFGARKFTEMKLNQESLYHTK